MVNGVGRIAGIREYDGGLHLSSTCPPPADDAKGSGRVGEPPSVYCWHCWSANAEQCSATNANSTTLSA